MALVSTGDLNDVTKRPYPPLLSAIAPVPQPSPSPTSLTAPPPDAPTQAPPSLVQPLPAAAQAHYNRVTKPPLAGPQAHTSADTGQSGIGQIHSPLARIPLQILDAIGGGLFPGIEQRIPGTEGHHGLVVRQAEGAVNQGEKQATEQAQRTHLGAETGKLQTEIPQIAPNAEAGRQHLGAETNKLNAETPEIGPNAQSERDLRAAQTGHANAETAATENGKYTLQHIASPDGSVHALVFDPQTGAVTASQVYKGDPKVETDLADLEVNGKPHKVLVDKRTGKTIQDLGESGVKPPTVNVNAATAGLDREIAHYGKPYETAHAAASGQLDKILDAEKMVAGGAMQQALGIPKVLTALVSGQGSGVRITQAELDMIAKARGIGGDIEGWFNKIKGQGQLTETQKQQLGQILKDVRERIVQKQEVSRAALDSINGARTREEIVAADKAARESLDKLERGGASTSGPKEVKTKAEYDALPSGAVYMEDGKQYRKP